MASEYKDAELLRQEAMHRVSENAGKLFRAEAFRVGVELARSHKEFTSLDVKEGLPTGVHAHDDRALGAVMQKLARQDVVVRTDRTVISARRRNHNRPVRVWSSLLYGVCG